MAKILTIDDSRLSVMFVKRILESLHIECIALNRVTSLFEDIGFIEKHQPDIIFLDILMPDMDGISALKMLKKIPQTEEIPVMMLTASSSKENVTEALRLGAVGFLSKPFDPDILIKQLKTVSEKAGITHLQTILARSNRSQERDNCDSLIIGTLDLNYMNNILDGDQTMMRELIQAFLDRLPKLLKGIELGITNQQGRMLRLSSHTLKGSVSNFSDEGIRDVCARLMSMGEEQNYDQAPEALAELKRRALALQRDLTTWMNR